MFVVILVWLFVIYCDCRCYFLVTLNLRLFCCYGNCEEPVVYQLTTSKWARLRNTPAAHSQ